jgi:GDPmannose 4,6-dehydratase
MYLMLQQDEPDNYLLATGEPHSVGEFVDAAFRHVGITDWQDHVYIDPAFQRPAELFALHGSPERTAKKLNWRPTVDFDELVAMMVDADLERLSRPALPVND